MYCNKCGQTLPEGSRFCNSCGSQTLSANGPSDGPVAVASYADEQEIFTLRPTMIFVLIRYIVAALITIAAAALMGILSSRSAAGPQISFFVILGVALVAFSNPVYKHILRKREVYSLTNHKLEMRYGIIAKIVRNIPLRNIQDVTVTASVWQRFLNLGDIEIDSASEAGKIILDDIHHPERYANQILAELRRRN
ncbi:MAG TPA: PH domain-containing protein [Blastocatellia bacterium]|nr:PH domain-containing protein [Blastocatellia bacterium]